MAMTNVYTGANGSLVLANQDTPEGNDARAIIELYAIQTVGRVTNVEVYVRTHLTAFHEIGRRHPTSLHPGNIFISGKIGRAYINGALLFLLLGRGASRTAVAEPFAQPAFNMILNLVDSAVPGNNPVLEVGGVKLQNWSYAVPEDEFAMEEVTFQALTLRVFDLDAGNAINPTFPAAAT